MGVVRVQLNSLISSPVGCGQWAVAVSGGDVVHLHQVHNEGAVLLMCLGMRLVAIYQRKL